jgi:TLD
MIIGGGLKGRAAIIISDCFTKGHSAKSETYGNEILCGENIKEADLTGGNFLVEAMEIWGFDVDTQ